jgi:phage-related protein
MATFTYAPDFDARQEVTPQVSKFVAGDGYEQRIQFGLHPAPAEWSLTFSKRTESERDAILDFLEARGGIENFTWVTPNGAEKLFICAEWQATQEAYNSNTIQATFFEVFEA